MSISIDPDSLTDFQKWVLFYFLRDKNAQISGEDLADNMCLTATIDFDIKNIRPELDELVRKGLIGTDIVEEIIDPDVSHNIGNRMYTSTLDGRFFVKQKILAPLIKVKNAHRIGEAITYLEQREENTDLVNDLKKVLGEKDQNKFIQLISNIALRDIVPFLELIKSLGSIGFH